MDNVQMMTFGRAAAEHLENVVVYRERLFLPGSKMIVDLEELGRAAAYLETILNEIDRRVEQDQRRNETGTDGEGK